jgi:uncharacterized membrane protein
MTKLRTMRTNKLVLSVQPTQQQLVDYQNSVAQVNMYAYAITQTSLPVLNDPPSDYGQFFTEFSPAKAHCLNWVNSIFPIVLALPTNIIQADNLFSLDETEVGGYLQILINDPNNSQAKQGLAQALGTMRTLVQGQLTTAQGLLGDINTFSTQITADATNLSKIAAQALADAGADQTKINNLNTDIDNLNARINTMQKWLTLSEIGIGLSIFVGLIGAVVCFIPGAQGIGIGIIVIGVAGLAGSIAGTIILTKEIQAAQDEISEQKQITGLKQDIIQLTGVNKQFQWLVTANQSAQNAMTTVVQMWQNLDTDLSAVITDLTDVNNDVTSAQYAQAQTDLQNANTAWQAVVTFAKALANINYNFQDQNGNWHTFGSQPVQPNGATVTPIQSPQKLAAA